MENPSTGEGLAPGNFVTWNDTNVNPSENAEDGWRTILRTTMILIVSLLIVISNILNILVIRQTTAIPAITKLCLLNLSVADLSAGLISCLPAVVSSAVGVWPYGPVWCQVSGLVHSMSVSISIWSLALVSLDRYVAILHPLRYVSLMTETRIRGIIVCMWSLAFLIYLIPLMASAGFMYYQYSKDQFMCGLYWEFRALCYFTAACVPLMSGIIIVVTNFRVVRSVLRLRTVINALPTDSQAIATRAPAASANNFKAVKVLLLTSSVYFIMWGPYVVVYVFMMGISPEITYPGWLLFSVTWLANSNSFVNVIIYSCFYSSFRRKAWVLAITCCGLRGNVIERSADHQSSGADGFLTSNA